MTSRAALFSGTLFALAAGLMWGLVFVAPLLLPQYPAALLSVGRYVAFGLIALPLAWVDRATLRCLTRADWIEALKLSLVGNLVYSLVLGMSVPDVSGSCIANLEVETLSHKKPTFHGDTIYAETRVLDATPSSSKPDRGIVTVETKGLNQRGEEVCYFRRKLMVWTREAGPKRQRPYGDEIWGE